MVYLLVVLFAVLISFCTVLSHLSFNFFRKQKPALFVCDFCDSRFAEPQELVDHLWEEHRYPAELHINGRVFRSGPSAILDRYFLRLWASRKLR